MKTANELARDLRDFIINIQSDAHNIGSINRYRYNNLKVEIVDPRITKEPQVLITIGISEAVFNINTGEKILGGLGPDERYIYRWLIKSIVATELKEIYKFAEKQVGKANDKTKD